MKTLLLILLLVPAFVGAQPKTIMGRVVDAETGKPIGVKVSSNEERVKMQNKGIIVSFPTIEKMCVSEGYVCDYITCGADGSFSVTVDFSKGERLYIRHQAFLTSELKKDTDYSTLRLRRKTTGELDNADELAYESLQIYPSPSSFIVVEKQPEIVDVNSFKDLLIYPKVCLDEGVQGIVTVRILVSKEGAYLSHIVLRSPHPEMTKEVQAKLSMLKFKPGIQAGKAIAYWGNLKIPFREGKIQTVTFGY